MKIVLISLPVPFLSEPATDPSLGLGYICSYLKSKGIDNVEILNFALFDYDYYNSIEYLQEIPLDADFYGISTVTSTYYWLYEVSKFLKENTKGKIVAGGAHPTSMARQCLEDSFIDYVVKGDGEEPMYQLVSGVSLDKIPGLCYWDRKNLVEKERHFQFNLDELPFPDRLDIEKYKRRVNGKKAFRLITLRGCPFKCAFCDKVSIGEGVRYRSVENVMMEIDEIIEQHGIKAFVISDDIFPLRKERTRRFCEEFKKRNLEWRCWCRADLINKDSLEIMKDSGLSSIQIGIESGDDDLLKTIKKGTTYEINKRAILICKEVGVPARCNLMYGNPGESLKTIKNTIRWAKESQPDEWTVFVLIPQPGSDIWINSEKYGIIFDKQLMRDKKYIMTDRFSDSGVGNIWISLKGTRSEEFKDNLKYFISELERVCPRKSVQDTVQTFDIDKMRVLK